MEKLREFRGRLHKITSFDKQMLRLLNGFFLQKIVEDSGKGGGGRGGGLYQKHTGHWLEGLSQKPQLSSLKF